MKLFIVLSAVIAITLAEGDFVNIAQDTHGNYKIDFDVAGSRKLEERKADGTVVGSYSFVDKLGELHEVKYEAGPEIGFRVISGLPVAPVPLGPVPVESLPIAPVPVMDTPEVLAARAEHLKLLELFSKQ